MRVIIYILVLFSMLSCNSGQPKYEGNITGGRWLKNIKINSDIEGANVNVPLQIYFPKGYKPGKEYISIILLHQYNKNQVEWERFSAVERYADKFGYILVAPNMSTSCYETKFFEETTRKWQPKPGALWIGENLVPFLQNKFSICNSKNKTAIVGVDIGGRGAIIVAEKYPSLFKCAASLSGIYVMNILKNESVFSGVYGNYKTYKDRWEQEDRLLKETSNLENVSIYVAHGQKDHQVPYRHARVFAIALNNLKKKNREFNYKYNEKKSGKNDWIFWNQVLPDLFSFIKLNMEK